MNTFTYTTTIDSSKASEMLFNSNLDETIENTLSFLLESYKGINRLNIFQTYDDFDDEYMFDFSTSAFSALVLFTYGQFIYNNISLKDLESHLDLLDNELINSFFLYYDN